MVFQGFGLFPHMTVRQNIAYGPRIAKRPADEIAERVAAIIALVHLEEQADRAPDELSGGQAQRVALARALVMRPKVLLLDEPLGALDAMTKISMQEELARIWSEESVTMVMVTHDLEEAIYLADRVLILPKEKGGAARLIDVDLPRPRDRSERRFVRYREELLREFGLH